MRTVPRDPARQSAGRPGCRRGRRVRWKDAARLATTYHWLMTAKAILATITIPTVIAAATDVISKSCRDWLSIARSPLTE